jgi:surface polysaccharide O-acyltransferase-like enzyme
LPHPARNVGIDAFRIYFQVLIVWGHVTFFGFPDPTDDVLRAARYVLVSVARASMPFYFLVAGYFFQPALSADAASVVRTLVGYTIRLGRVFVFWSAVYAALDPAAFMARLAKPLKLLLQGTQAHLWFLPSLILTAWLAAAFRARPRLLLALGVLLYALGLLGGAYRLTPVGLDLHFNTRDAVFLSTIFFAFGMLWRARMPGVTRGAALALAAAGWLLGCGEALFLSRYDDSLPLLADYLLGTVPLGVGLTLFAFQSRSALDARVAPLAPYVLGIYVSHLLFFALLRPLGAFVPSAVWVMAFPALVFLAALALTALLMRTPLRVLVG